MARDQWLAERFEADRRRLREVAYRLLGSSTEADDAVQEAWLRLSRSDTGGIDNLSGWLTTVVARICLDMLRARRTREETLAALADRSAAANDIADFEQEELVADAVGLALAILLDKLTPPERVEFVLYDVFDIPFREIAPILGRTTATARQLASRARRQVRGRSAIGAAELSGRRRVAAEFLDAVRAGNMDAVVALLDPNVVIRVDASASPGRRPVEARGPMAVARGALAFAARARSATVMLVNGAPGIAAAQGGRLRYALAMDIAEGRIRTIDVIGDTVRLSQIEFATID
ncbi:sigma-70 family RNA polymerase sigma factor [Inquilinus limosus]|uniref:sigma-70 family RNA polymerase sigma factor n=1 Tax=Inquilinus limosus TaxID=171674 RepID=UPI000423E894|nr:sigma-70 family RNA polymerase sigma factor [Inquilinus limosus]